MEIHENKTQESQNSIASKITKESSNGGTAQLIDNRITTSIQRKLQDTMNSTKANSTAPIQVKVNKTGLPDDLKSGIENLSGQSMDDVKVQYNSSKPAQLQAHAYAQGTDIYLSPGQEKHLAHEAWHVVQQKQGRVRPTRQLKSKVHINDDTALEKEADIMGKKAINTRQSQRREGVLETKADRRETVQRAQKTEQIRLFSDGSMKTITWDDTDRLGRGAMGAVYEGVFEGRSVAIKMGEGIDNEIDVFARIYTRHAADNPAIIKPIGYSVNKKILVIEKADGSLDHTLPVTLQAKLSMIKDIWRGLNFLHDNGVMYQDMSQKNTLFKGGKALLADFGNSTDLGTGAPIPEAFIPDEEYLNFTKMSCNILLGATGTNNTDSFMTPAKLVELRNLLTWKDVKAIHLDAVENVAKKRNPTKAECELFVTNLGNCIKGRRKAFMKLINS